MKRIFVVMVSLLLTCNVLSYTVTAVTDKQQYAGEQLHTLGLMRGYTDGTLQLQSAIKRAEVAALLVRTLGYDNKEVIGNPKAFSDVRNDSWAKQDIQKAYKLKLIVGDQGGTFRPNDQISYAEVVTIMVNALGKNDNLEGDWPTNYITKAKQLGIISQTEQGNVKRKVTRGEVSLILWDTILAKHS